MTHSRFHRNPGASTKPIDSFYRAAQVNAFVIVNIPLCSVLVRSAADVDLVNWQLVDSFAGKLCLQCASQK